MSDGKWLIDDGGRFWLWGDQNLAGHLQASSNPHELWSFCILNLGFIEVDRRAQSLRIRVRPTFADATALAALLYWLHEASPSRTVLTSWSKSGWTNEIIGDQRRLIQCICAFPAASQQPAGTWFVRRRAEVASVPPSDPIAKVIRVLTKPAGVSIALASQLCDELFCGKFTIVQREDNGRHTILSQGQGYAIYDKCYMKNAVGTFIEDDPNVDYGRWVAQGLREVAQQRRPIIEDVSAALVGPHGRQRVSYRRVMVPLQSGGHRPVALTASRLRSIAPIYNEVV